MIPESTLSKLIEIGTSLEWDDPTVAPRLNEIKNEDQINRLHWSEWNTVTAKLSIDEIVPLIKGLVAAEEKLRWIGGSVSAVIWVFRELERRDHILATEVSDWILNHSSNPWVPFGSSNFGAKSLEELRRQKAAREERKSAAAASETKQQEDGKLRRQQRKMKSNHRLLLQKEATAQRQSIISEFQSLTSEQRLIKIATDVDHPIEFFPSEFAQVDRQTLKSLDESTRETLLHKLKHVGKGPWKQLRIALESVSQGAACA